ncbi:MAG: PKD domain-containing protein [Candidatus Lutacidiplasmatales archaeon]
MVLLLVTGSVRTGPPSRITVPTTNRILVLSSYLHSAARLPPSAVARYAPTSLPPVPSVRPSSGDLNGTWLNLTQPGAPPPRQAYAFAYDPQLGGAILFGGQATSGAPLQDTWEWKNGSWKELGAPLSPSPSGRWSAGLVYDPQISSLVLFGGAIGAGATIGDTWTFNASGWTKLSPAASPPSQAGVGLLYNTGDSALELFNDGVGYAGNPSLWSFANGTWTDQSGKSVGSVASLGYHYFDDAADRVVVLFGGSNSCGGYGYTYTYHNEVYVNETPNESISPHAVAGSGVVTFDPNLGGAVMFSGYDNTCTLTDETWLFRQGQWANLTANVAPPPPGRWDARMVYDPVAVGDVTFGGNEAPVGGSNRFIPDTWAFHTGLGVRATATPPLGTAPLTVVLRAVAQGGVPPYSFSWSFADNTTNATGATVTHTYNSSGVYQAVVHVVDGNRTPGVGTVSINVARPLSVSGTPSVSGGDAPVYVGFTASSTGGVGPTTFLWTFGDGGNANGSVVTHLYPTPGSWIWTLTGTDSLGDVATAGSTLQTFAPLGGQSSATPSTGAPPLKVEFTLTPVNGDGPFHVTWEFGDGSALGTGETTNHTYSSLGTYLVLASVTDSGGGVNVSALNITVVVPPLNVEAIPTWVYFAAAGALAVAGSAIVVVLTRPRPASNRGPPRSASPSATGPPESGAPGEAPPTNPPTQP